MSANPVHAGPCCACASRLLHANVELTTGVDKLEQDLRLLKARLARLWLQAQALTQGLEEAVNTIGPQAKKGVDP